LNSRIKSNAYLSFLLIALAFSCAQIEAPSGGPEDKTPPEIISVTPKSGSVKVPLDTELEIIFSKNMNKSCTSAVFISPLFFDYPKYKWSGKKLKITLPEKLKPNTTHVLTIGASAQDSRGNKLGQSISTSFSTGETIYTGSIYGKVLASELQKLNVWAYKLPSSQPDTFWMKLPDYVTQPDSFGDFRFEYLSYGAYLVVAVDDKNSDQFWAPPGEKMALPDTLVYLSEEQLEFGPLLMMPVERDTLAPYLSGVSSPDNQTIVANFSQKMDIVSLLLKENYTIFNIDDSSANPAVINIFPMSDELKAAIIKCSAMTPEQKYKIAIDSIRSHFNIIADTLSRFFSAGDIDTAGPELIAITPNPSLQPQLGGSSIKLQFSETIDTLDFSTIITFTDTLSNLIEYLSDWPYPNQVIFKPAFEEGEKYLMLCDMSRILDMAGNPAGDTIITYTYNIASKDSLGQIVGQVVNAPGTNIKVAVYPARSEPVLADTDENGRFIFPYLFPGSYIIRTFYDINGNGLFDGGQIRPFEYAEPIGVYADSVQVRARWETDIGVLDFAPSTK